MIKDFRDYTGILINSDSAAICRLKINIAKYLQVLHTQTVRHTRSITAVRIIEKTRAYLFIFQFPFKSLV